MSKSEGKIIGPFLGPRGEAGVEIFIALPDEQHPTEDLNCRLYENGNEIKSCKCSWQKDFYKLFSFRFENLDDDKTYEYRFFMSDKNSDTGGKPLDLEFGLTEEDCRFQVLGKNAEGQVFRADELS